MTAVQANVTGRKPGVGAGDKAAIALPRGPPEVEAAMYSIAEFCAAHRISRAYYYELLKQNRAPRITRLGTRRLISMEDAAAWRTAMAEASAA
jgi:predicted DNA-binding transcriptional regulator AlpA